MPSSYYNYIYPTATTTTSTGYVTTYDYGDATRYAYYNATSDSFEVSCLICGSRVNVQHNICAECRDAIMLLRNKLKHNAEKEARDAFLDVLTKKTGD